MKNTDKILIRYKSGELAEDFSEALKGADEDDLRIFLAAILLEEQSGKACVQDICKLLSIDESMLSASLKYWRGAGFIGRARRTAKADTESGIKTARTKLPDAHKGGRIEGSSLPSYTTSELTALIEKRKITSDFIAEAQRVYGKMFNQTEVATVIRMIDYIGFDEECVLTLLSFYSRPERKTVRYIEKVALEFYDEDINTIGALQARLRQVESSRSFEGKVRTLFGMGSRALTTKEKKYIAAWHEKMNFDIEMIRLAYDITVEKTHEATPAYANAILERWYADGIDTPEKALKAGEKRAEQKPLEAGKSFDNTDFFEAALRRSYEG